MDFVIQTSGPAVVLCEWQCRLFLGI